MSSHGGGGGGGYSGGGGGARTVNPAGGGGSYNDGYSQVNQSGVQSGNGYVTIVPVYGGDDLLAVFLKRESEKSNSVSSVRNY